MKREKPEHLLNDVILCVQLGWTLDELERQPTRFVERLQIYLNTLADMRSREQERFEDEIQRMRALRT